MRFFADEKRKLGIWLSLLVLIFGSSNLNAQFETKWMAVGSTHNWYSEIGSEIEEGLIKEQQFGLRWPAIYNYQDMQAAKALWIGAAKFKDAADFGGLNFKHKVVHVGPRVTGSNEFFPIEFKMISKFPAPEISVDGNLTEITPSDIDEVDPDLPYDRMIYNVVNTQLGLTMERKIYQFSQVHHDNYIITDVTFTNTGNVDSDPDIELPNNTLDSVYIYYHYRWAVSRLSGYVIGNATRWGINTMLDVRGDGVRPDAPTENFRANFAWHGKYPPFVAYDNLGGPIWQPDGVGITTDGDTLGRLGSSQFVGVVTLHADTSPTDQTDDPSQPSTTSWEGSDEPNTSNNDAFNPVRMDSEWNWITRGHKAPRHAYAVEPAGKFTEPTGDPALGTPGGFSNANGYGPYTLAPGESFRIVWAEAANGLSYQQNLKIGKAYKAGQITAIEKNEWVLTSRDSLFKTFRRALANFNNNEGYIAPEPPYPPSTFEVVSGGDRIQLNWSHSGEGPAITGFELYRATGRYDSTANLIYTAGPAETTYDDTEVIRGEDNYYYIVAVGDANDNSGAAQTPPGALRSGRYYTQTYDPATLKRPAGEAMEDVRIVPNPFILSADSERLRFPGQRDRLAFFNIPGNCTIQIYTELGELIETIDHADGSGDAYWDSVTSEKQIVVSGIYIAVVTNNDTGERKILKFAIIR